MIDENAALIELCVPMRALNALETLGVRTVGQLVRMPRAELAGIRSIGRKTLQETEEALREHGLALGMRGDVAEWTDAQRRREESAAKRDTAAMASELARLREWHSKWLESRQSAADRAIKRWVDGDLRVYVIRCGLTGLRKIGVTRDVEKRLAALRTLSSVGPSLVVEVVIRGPARLERDLHRRFAGERRHGEWFALSDEDVECLRAEFASALVPK